MTLPGKVIEAPDGLHGFDCNSHLSGQAAAAFRQDGMRFALRYVPRHAGASSAAGDISGSEASGILSAGLGLMIVQHVNDPGWVPTGALGKEYGAFAAKSALDIGYQFGGMVWCDLEGVKLKPDERDTIAFLNYWLDQVGHAGFTPGLYVGYNSNLTADELYHRLRFSHYWSAYNLNADQFPAVRGVQMKQGTEITRHGVKIDPDTIRRDALGGLPLMHVDNEWTAN
jgi:hypothetical protein